MIKGGSGRDWGAQSELFHGKVGRKGKREWSMMTRICGKLLCCKLSRGEMIPVDGKVERGRKTIVGRQVRTRNVSVSVIIAIGIELSVKHDF